MTLQSGQRVLAIELLQLLVDRRVFGIEQANKDVNEVRISSDKISRRFQQIERVELDHPEAHPARLLDSDD